MVKIPQQGDRRPLKTKLIGFGFVGLVGFIIDAGLTTWLDYALSNPFSARLIGMGFSTLTTWRLNRILTFGASHTSQKSEALRYGLVALGTAILNYLTYTILIMFFLVSPPVLAIIGATGVSMCLSYLGFNHLVFIKKRRSE